MRLIYKTDLLLLIPVADLIQNTRRYYEINILSSVTIIPTHVGPTISTVGKVRAELSFWL
jgi:hypothetical protein